MLLARPELEGGIGLGQVDALRAADGNQIPAYLTLPAGPPARPARGRPSAWRTELARRMGFDWLAQFLAARGYAVIQPNYRGSSGYGDEFLAKMASRTGRHR